MKNIFFKTVIAICFIVNSMFAQNKPQINLVIEGQYAGKNVFIKNAYGPGGAGYCITETKVNGKVTKDEINASIFQINLAALGLKEGDNVKIEIKHYKNCTPASHPIIINPGVLLGANTKQNNECSLIVDGTFLWQNVFIFNPRLPDGKGYGIKEIFVNGQSITSKIDLDIFEVNLMGMGFKENEKIKMEFKYTKGFDPIFLNPEALN